MSESFVAGSQHVLTGTIADVINGVRVLKDLSGAAVAIKVLVNGVVAKSLPAVADADQALNRGKYSYSLSSTDLDIPGSVELQAWVTIGGMTTKSRISLNEVIKSLA